MVANIRCEEIAADQLAALLEDQAWAALKAEAAGGVVSDFGERASALLHSCLTGNVLCNSSEQLLAQQMQGTSATTADDVTFDTSLHKLAHPIRVC